MEEWTLREQYEVQQLQEERLMEELLQGEQPVVPLNRKVPLNGEVPLKEGEGTCLLLNLDHPPSCNNSTENPAHPLSQREYQVKEGEGASPPLYLDLPLSQRENQVKVGEEASPLLNSKFRPLSFPAGIPGEGGGRGFLSSKFGSPPRQQYWKTVGIDLAWEEVVHPDEVPP